MAKKSDEQGRQESREEEWRKNRSRGAVTRVSSAKPSGDEPENDRTGDAFIKLLQSPLVAELVAVAATAALAALAEHGFTSRGAGMTARGKRAGKAVKEAGKAAAAAVGRRLGNEIDEISGRRLRAAQKRKPRAADLARGSTSSPPGSSLRRGWSRRSSSHQARASRRQAPPRRRRCPNPAHRADRRRSGRTARRAAGPAPSRAMSCMRSAAPSFVGIAPDDRGRRRRHFRRRSRARRRAKALRDPRLRCPRIDRPRADPRRSRGGWRASKTGFRARGPRSGACLPRRRLDRPPAPLAGDDPHLSVLRNASSSPGSTSSTRPAPALRA